jgi:hypothetical protein
MDKTVFAKELLVGDKFITTGTRRMYQVVDSDRWIDSSGHSDSERMTCKLVNTDGSLSSGNYWVGKNSTVYEVEWVERQESEVLPIEYKQKYLYQSVAFDQVAAFLEDRAEDGWELISVIPTTTNKSYSYVLMMKVVS